MSMVWRDSRGVRWGRQLVDRKGWMGMGVPGCRRDTWWWAARAARSPCPAAPPPPVCCVDDGGFLGMRPVPSCRSSNAPVHRSFTQSNHPSSSSLTPIPPPRHTHRQTRHAPAPPGASWWRCTPTAPWAARSAPPPETGAAGARPCPCDAAAAAPARRRGWRVGPGSVVV